VPSTPEPVGIEELRAKAASLRRTILGMCAESGGHLVSSFSCVEILVALYHGGGLRLRPERSGWTDVDRFILSKGHAETALFAVLADLRYFPREWLQSSYRRNGCMLGGHPDHRVPGVEVTSGSLGHGLGIAAGMALAARLDGRDQRIYTLLGDAECTEGSVWEAAMFAAHRQLDNLVAIIDRNGLGCLDFTDNYTGLEPLADKWRAFGWEVHCVEGHSFEQLLAATRPPANAGSGRPRAIIAKTVKGKGVSFLENDPSWHVRQISAREAVAAERELEVLV
jgi:transketolase